MFFCLMNLDVCNDLDTDLEKSQIVKIGRDVLLWGINFREDIEPFQKLMSFAYRMGFCVFIMTITVAKMSLMVIYAIYALVMFPDFTCTTNHTYKYYIEDKFVYFL